MRGTAASPHGSSVELCLQSEAELLRDPLEEPTARALAKLLERGSQEGSRRHLHDGHAAPAASARLVAGLTQQREQEAPHLRRDGDDDGWAAVLVEVCEMDEAVAAARAGGAGYADEGLVAADNTDTVTIGFIS